MRLVQGILLLSLCLVIAFGACRRNTPSLVDTNEAPDTDLWYAPPDSTDYEYLVHLYWRGKDNDGKVVKYIWTIRDSLVFDETTWSPADRLRDLREGRFTAQTDSVFSFTAFKNVGGVGVKKNRQAFLIAAVDDNGVIDPSPAGVEFIAVIDEVPLMFFHTTMARLEPPETRRYVHHLIPQDTVGMFKPFDITYHGSTNNGRLTDYLWFPLSQTIKFPGANKWTTDFTDTTRSFANSGAFALPPKIFRLGAKVRDSAGAESAIDASSFQRGVAQVVVNFDPDTRINRITNTYNDGTGPVTKDVDFDDPFAVPDTVPFRSWIKLYYQGWDDKRDKPFRCPPSDQGFDSCIKFQISYERRSNRVAGATGKSGWLPSGAVHDTDSTAAADSNTVNVGSLEYDFSVRSIDENGTVDGTPASVHIVGNYDPTLDSIQLEDITPTLWDTPQPAKVLNLTGAEPDTIVWNFWKGVGWPYAFPDTIDIFGNSEYIKTFKWRFRATGHDDPKEAPGFAGIRSWNFDIRDSAGQRWRLGQATGEWRDAITIDVLDDVFTLTIRYPSPFSAGPGNGDPNGDTVFAKLPGFMNQDLTVTIQGRDTGSKAKTFSQWVHIGIPPPGQKARHGEAEKILVNDFSTVTLGRWTQKQRFKFHVKLVR